MTRINKSVLSVAVFAALGLTSFGAHAQSRLEDMLRNPLVQQLIGYKLPELKNEQALCGSSAFRAANPQRCAAVIDAIRAQQIPLELRAVLTNPASAAALRELCVSSPQLSQTNYLCVELGKGDATMGVEVQNRLYQLQAGDQRP